MRYYMNIKFDMKLAPDFFLREAPRHRVVIGERYGDFTVQFASAKSALEAIRKYRGYLTECGYTCNGDLLNDCHAYTGNYQPTKATILHDIERESFFGFQKVAA